MRRRRAGAIVVVSSNAAGVPRIGMGAYGSSKAAATMLVRTAGLELATDGISCQRGRSGIHRHSDAAVIVVGPFRRFGCRRGHRRQSGELSPGYSARKLATADDIADSVHFLLSDRAAHITMQALLRRRLERRSKRETYLLTVLSNRSHLHDLEDRSRALGTRRTVSTRFGDELSGTRAIGLTRRWPDSSRPRARTASRQRSGGRQRCLWHTDTTDIFRPRSAQLGPGRRPVRLGCSRR